MLQVSPPPRAAMQIDTTSYRKDTTHPQRWGYQSRGSAVPSSIIIHTTSNKRATQFQTEATYLLNSADVSAHFLISKTGDIIQFLDPLRWQAWHAGLTIDAFLNVRSIGIEHHVSVGEVWTDAQHAASTWLVRELMAAHGIARGLVDMHRAVALPKGRKQDPAGWDDDSFYAWRNALALDPPPTTKRYRVKGIPVYERSDHAGPLWGCLKQDDVIEIDDPKNGHIAAVNGQPAPIGFIRFDPDTLEAMF